MTIQPNRVSRYAVVLAMVLATSGGTLRCNRMDPLATDGSRTSTVDWQGESLSPQTDVFTATIDAVPHAAGMDGVIALSAGTIADLADVAVLVRFSPSGMIEATNGDLYAADQPIAYIPDQIYRFRLAVDVPSHTYSVCVTPPDEPEQVLADHYAFRREQADASSLGYWAWMASAARTLSSSSKWPASR